MGWKSYLYKILDIIEIPEEIKRMKGRLILHISDTPSCFYHELDRIIKILDPPWIIHTGDLVDQVKLGLYPNRKDLYAMKLRKLRNIMQGGEQHKARHIVLAMGNHDNKTIVAGTFKGSVIIPRESEITVEKFNLDISHYYFMLRGGKRTYNLYGHEPFLPSSSGKDRIEGILLNGLISMNFINLDSGAVYSLPYPRYMDDSRQLKHKTGF